MRSNAATTRRTIASMAATSPTSVSTARPRRPSPATASAVDLASPGSMSTAATCAPARASASAVALPIPVPAPVTIATRSATVMLAPPGVVEGPRIPYSSQSGAPAPEETCMSNRAVVVDLQAPGRLVIASVRDPTPDRGEAIVRVRAISLNRGEVRRAGMAAAGWRPGWDLAGEVERAATDGSGPRVGARVVGMLGEGAWAERVAVPTHALAALPDNVTFSQAASLPVAGLTALYALEKGGLLLDHR